MNRRELYRQMRAAGVGILPPDIDAIGSLPLYAKLIGNLGRLGIRVGLLAGVAVGTLVWLAALSVDRQVGAAPTDALQLWLGLCAVLAVLGLHVGMVGAAVHLLWMLARKQLRHRRYLPAVYGGIQAGVATAVFGALVWRRMGGAVLDVERMGARDLLAVLGIIVAAVWVGRAVSLLLGVWRSRGLTPPLAPRPRRVGAAWRTVVVGVLVCALLWHFHREHAPAYPSRDQRVAETLAIPPQRHVIVLGIDGLGWDEARAGMGDGSLTNWDALERSGARGRMYSDTGQGPAAFWITVATGVRARAHGARALVTPLPAGGRHPLAVAPEYVGVREVTFRLLRRAGLSRPVPVSRASVRRWCAWEVVRQAGGEAGVVGWWGAWPGAGEAGTLDMPALLQGLWHANDPLAVDARVGEGLRAILHRSPRPSLTMAYFPGLDLLHRVTDGYADAGRLEAHRRFLDAIIGEAAAALGPEDLLLVVGDRGDRRADAPVFRALREEEGGVLLAAGSGILPATRLSRPRPEDVWPTMAWWLGLPPATDWDGQAWTDLRADRAAPGDPVDYGRPARLQLMDEAVAALRTRQLRDAGYLP